MKHTITYNPKDMTGKEWIDFAYDNGFLTMEIAYTMLPESDEEKDELINYAKSKGFSLSIHSPYGRNNITDTDTLNREKSISQAKASIDFAAKHNLSSVTFHPSRLSAEDEVPE